MYEDWNQYQIENKSKVINYDVLEEDNIFYVGGLDISFCDTEDMKHKGVAVLTIVDYKTKEVVYSNHLECSIYIPYVSGYLGFREVPAYKELLEQAKHTPFFPQIVLVDGCGIMHHREFGSASHLGVEFDIPTIGVAKTLLCIDGLTDIEVSSRFEASCKKKGDSSQLVGKSGKIWGAALKATDSVKNPIYVSIGHKVSLEQAVKIVTNMCLYRIPEPIRLSDIKSRTLILNI